MNYPKLSDVRAAHALSDADFLALMTGYDLRPVVGSLVTFSVLRERFARAYPADGEAGPRVKTLLAAVRAVDADVANAIVGSVGVDANLPEIVKALATYPNQADAEIVRDLGRAKKFIWELAGLDQAPTQDHLDTLPRYFKIKLLEKEAKDALRAAGQRNERQQEVLVALLANKEPVPDTADEIK